MADKKEEKIDSIESKKFQLKYAAVLSLLAVVAGAVVVGSVYYLENYTADIPFWGRAFIWIILVVLGAVMGGIYIYQKVTGPVYRLDMLVDKIIEGEYENNISLKSEDELYKLSCKLNMLIERLKEDRILRKRSLKSVRDKLERGEIEAALKEMEELSA